MIRLAGSNPFTINHYICFFSQNMQLLCVACTYWLKKTVGIFSLVLLQASCALAALFFTFSPLIASMHCSFMHIIPTITHKDICTVTVSGELSEEDGYSCLHKNKISLYWSRTWEICMLTEKWSWNHWNYEYLTLIWVIHTQINQTEWIAKTCATSKIR